MRVLIVLSGSLLAWSTASSAKAGDGATGNAATIAFYRSAQHSYLSVPGVEEIRHGFLYYEATASVYHWRSGPAPGFEATSETLLLSLSKGAVSGYVDTITAPDLPRLTIIENTSGVWDENTTDRCFSSSPRSTGVGGWGSQLIGVLGNFEPMRRAGNTVTVTSTFPWAKLGTATEVDRISAKSRQFISSRDDVHTSSPFSFSASYTTLHKPPTIPAATPVC